jgi:N-acetylglutamate synthase/N-acetylornithine aminotransferase
MTASEVEMSLGFGAREEESVVYFCDLGHEYVDVNSEYS